MTTAVLARKLFTVKLSKREFDKIKWLRANNSESKLKVISSLKQLINKQVLNKTCRICLKPGEKQIFDRDHEFNLVSCIQNILGIQVTENDGKPQHLCKACETTIKNAEHLKQTAEVTQWRLQQELDFMAGVSDTEVTEDSTHHGGYFIDQGAKVTREWRCGKCRRTFDKQEDFSEHEQAPTCRAKKCYMCENCGLELKSMSRLNRHRLIHSGELKYSCSQCPYRGRTKYAVVVHERLHSDSRPVSCSVCSATFLNSSNLASHRRSHLPPKYHCHLCERSFRFKEALQNHIATRHSTAKPHVCDLCGKAFSTRKMICRHERRVHKRPKMRSGILPTYLKQQGLET